MIHGLVHHLKKLSEAAICRFFLMTLKYIDLKIIGRDFVANIFNMERR